MFLHLFGFGQRLRSHTLGDQLQHGPREHLRVSQVRKAGDDMDFRESASNIHWCQDSVYNAAQCKFKPNGRHDKWKCVALLKCIFVQPSNMTLYKVKVRAPDASR